MRGEHNMPLDSTEGKVSNKSISRTVVVTRSKLTFIAMLRIKVSQSGRVASTLHPE